METEFSNPGTPNSSNSAKRTLRTRGLRDADIIATANSLFATARSIAEYQWPQDYNPKQKVDEDDLWMVQEQIGNFLNINSFKRKYPDIERRNVLGPEADWLRDRGYVNQELNQKN